MLDALAERGVSRVYLEVEQANDAAIRLYAGTGFRPIGVLPTTTARAGHGVHMMADTGRPQAATSSATKTA